MFYTLGCFHKGLSSTLSYYCYDVAILALKAFAVKLNGIQKQRTWSSQRGIQSEKFIYFFLHRKCTLHTVRIWEMTLKGFYQEGALQLYPCTESKHGSQRWVLEELWAWVLGGGVIISLPPHAVPFHRLPGLYDSRHTLWAGSCNDTRAWRVASEEQRSVFCVSLSKWKSKCKKM